jgi:Transposase and inactivated derivatives
MKNITKQKKQVVTGLKKTYGSQELVEHMSSIILNGKHGLDVLIKEMGRQVAETIMYIEREEIAGPDYKPISADIWKWASEPGSVYIGDQKIHLNRPRLRGPNGEISLKSYKKLKEREGFSDEVLKKVLSGISCRKYGETVVEAAEAFGVSPSSISKSIIEATTKQLKEFKERSLFEFSPFAIYLDTIHRGGEAFIVGLGINRSGEKLPLGFWQGATENHEICEELLADMQRRGLLISGKIIWITDGGKGIIKTLRDKFGKKLIHQRCIIHKDRNIQRHLAKKA